MVGASFPSPWGLRSSDSSSTAAGRVSFCQGLTRTPATSRCGAGPDPAGHRPPPQPPFPLWPCQAFLHPRGSVLAVSSAQKAPHWSRPGPAGVAVLSPTGPVRHRPLLSTGLLLTQLPNASASPEVEASSHSGMSPSMTKYLRLGSLMDRHLLVILEARCLRSRCRQGWRVLRPLSLVRRRPSLCVLTCSSRCESASWSHLTRTPVILD